MYIREVRKKRKNIYILFFTQNSVLIVALHGGGVIGASTGLPMIYEMSNVQKPFIEANYEMSNVQKPFIEANWPIESIFFSENPYC